MTHVDYGRLVEEIEWWVARRGLIEETAPVRELAGAAGVSERRISAIRAGERCSVDTAERILEAIDYQEGPRRHPTRGHFVAYPIRWTSVNRKVRNGQVGRLKKLDFKNAKLTYDELREVHAVHWEMGVSLREISRSHWKQWGYASAKACLTSLSDRLRECELPVRTQSEATAFANTKRRVRGADETKAQYKARKRREAREADPAVAEAQRQRIAWLRANHDPSQRRTR